MVCRWICSKDVDAEQVWLYIRDNGKGISAERLNAVEAGSWGLGLSAMRERVRELGGNLKIDSGDEGTTLETSIPITDATTESDSSKDPTPTGRSSAI